MRAYIEKQTKTLKTKMRPNRYIDKSEANQSAAPTGALGGRLGALLTTIKPATKVYTQIS